MSDRDRSQAERFREVVRTLEGDDEQRIEEPVHRAAKHEPVEEGR